MADSDNRKNKSRMTPGKMKNVDEVLEEAKRTRERVRRDIDNGTLPEIPKEFEEFFS